MRVRTKTKNDMAAKAARLTYPVEGVSLNAFGDLLMCDPRETEQIARYCFKKKGIWLSVRKGHLRIFAAVKHPGRGRPKSAEVEKRPVIDPALAGLLLKLHPTFLRLKVLKRSLPDGWWTEVGAARAEVRDAIMVEADNVMAACRRFAGRHPLSILGPMRDALWLDQPEMMAAVVEFHPDLKPGDAKLSATDTAGKRMQNGLSNHERVLHHIEKAGRNGIPASRVRTVMGYRITADELDSIARYFEQTEAIHIRQCLAPSGKGVPGTRFFDAAHGEPTLSPGGRLLLKQVPLELHA